MIEPRKLRRMALKLKRPYWAVLEQDDVPVSDRDLVVRSVKSTFKHGTEMTKFRGEGPFVNHRFDRELRMFVPGPDAPREELGNQTVGIVEWVGEASDRPFRKGDRVWGWLPAADWHVVSPKNELYPLEEGLTEDQALCVDPATFALGAVVDGGVKNGDCALVTGLGAIGLLAAQYARLAGADVWAACSFARRAALAERYGARIVPGPTGDIGETVKRAVVTQRSDRRACGVDVALECSGRYPTLHQAIRAVRQCGVVVCVGFYMGEAIGLRLGEEAFHNRLTLLFSLPAASWNNTVRGEPPLTHSDLRNRVVDDFRAGRLSVDGLIDPVVPFEQAVDALNRIDRRPAEVIKVGLDYSWPQLPVPLPWC